MAKKVIGGGRQCNKCGNEDMAFFYKGAKGWYCRKCVGYLNKEQLDYSLKEVDYEYHLAYELSDKQKVVSSELCRLVKEGKSVLLNAVCGAGKTELVLESIAYCLAAHKRVGFTIARRQVVLEICERLKSIFTNLKVIAVCGGHSDDINGDLIVCTTHQLYRYTDYFDLLIIDEPDAFPFKNNEILHGFAQSACKGSTIYLTATPDKQLLEMVNNGKLAYLYLNRRPHNHDLCVPVTKYGPTLILLFKAINWLKKEMNLNKQVIFFVPTRKQGRILFMFFKKIFKCCYLDSLTENKDEIIADFRKRDYDICIATTVLERGITIAGIDIIVYEADSGVFDKASLIQMSGRVGRNMKMPDGNCLFLCKRKTRSIDECLDDIERANSYV